MLLVLWIDQLAAELLEAGERALLGPTHPLAIAGNVGGEDRGELAFGLIRGHWSRLTPSSLSPYYHRLRCFGHSQHGPTRDRFLRSTDAIRYGGHKVDCRHWIRISSKTYPCMHHTAASAPIPAAGNDCCETSKQMLECRPKSTEDVAEIPKVRKGPIG